MRIVAQIEGDLRSENEIGGLIGKREFRPRSEGGEASVELK